MIRNKKALKVISILLLISFLNTIVNPAEILALTSGASSPEFSSFEPVATTDMVDIFSGDFTYNLPVVSIPGPDGGGYSLSLSYHSGVGPEEEASWVGYGWTLNPGAINRNKIGLPDDFNGDEVIKYNKTKPTWSVAGKANTQLELFSADKDANGKVKEYKRRSTLDKDNEKLDITPRVNISKSIRFNNYKGYMKSFGFGFGVGDIGSLNFNRSGGKFSISVSPTYFYNRISKTFIKSNSKADKILSLKFLEKTNISIKNVNIKFSETIKNSLKGSARQISSYGVRLLRGFSSPTHSTQYSGIAFNNDFGLNIFGFLPVGVELGYHSKFNLRVNKANNRLKAYGYMYNPNFRTYSKGPVLSDYYVEKEINYDKKDKYLGIPHSGADNFMATGSQVVGGFNLHHQHINHYLPQSVKSTQKIRMAGHERGAGPGIVNVGFNFGGGKQTNKIGNWRKFDYDRYNRFFPSYSLADIDYNRGSFFRFSNDLADDLTYFNTGEGKDVLSATINKKFLKKSPDAGNFSALKNSLGNVNQSSYIECKTNRMINDDPTSRLEKSPSIDSLLGLETIAQSGDKIAEYAITNESGYKYVYGLPVYTKNNKSLTLDVSHKKDKVNKNRYLAYKSVHTGEDIFKNRVVVGEETKNAYAINFLLTHIVTPDYVDVGNNGPDEYDFGGWTKFNYRKWESTDNNSWYHFRAPYTGLLYAENQIASSYDDMGTITSGDKQVYYMKAVETKSHVAFFITNKTLASDFVEYTGSENNNLNGSGDIRYDHLGATRESSSNFDPAAESKASKDINQQLEKLERIVLYSKADFSKPVQTVYFDYDYSLCGNLPNSAGPSGSKGKLTLKKVWFESEGVVNSRIAPYRFEYEYEKNYADEVIEKYPEITSYASKLDIGDQNPDYEPEALDMWGNYQFNGAERFKQRIPWVYQGNEIQDEFDPAAWNLKKIILPSGGEIHIQYEQKDYKYVQDKEAMAMCSLLPSGRGESYKPEDAKYYLNADDLGIQSSEEIYKYAEKLRGRFLPSDSVPNPELIYFKFLYALPDKDADYEKCWMEYISAYTNVNEIGIEGGKIFFKLGASRKWVSWFGNKLKRPNTTNVPRTVCFDYYVNNADGLIEGDNCDCDFNKRERIDNKIDQLYQKIIENDDKFSTIPPKTWRKEASKPAHGEIIGKILQKQINRKKVCKNIDEKRSFLRIPVYKSKKGGGIRVKRLMMYDRGIETGDAMLYGSEYIYKDENGVSSGVATNEPAEGREENALVQLLDKKNLKWLGDILYGEDLIQSEGPLGENLLPGPSIGHSRVVVQNIHKGKTNTGHTEYTYLTNKDYPIKVEHTNLDKDHNKRKFWIIPAPMFSYTSDKSYLAQGYRFVINQFHGRPASIKNFEGVYKQGGTNHLVSSTNYEYFDLESEDIRYLKYDPESQKLDVSYAKPGREEVITTEMKSIYDKATNFNLELDLSFLYPAMLIFICFEPSFSVSELLLNKHVTSTVVRYPAIVKSITNYSDAGTVVTENLAFNPHNGTPVLTRTNDGFDNVKLEYMNRDISHDGGYYTWNFPASWIYPELGPKSEPHTSGYRTNQLDAVAANIVSYGHAGNWVYDSTKSTVPASQMRGVLSASATTFKKNWFDGSLSIMGEYEKAEEYKDELNKNWYPKASYVFEPDQISSANQADTGKIYNAGIIKDFEIFNWTNADNTPDSVGKWIKTSEITLVSPHGNVLEEKNILGIYSAARFGYQKQLPILVAGNASYNSVCFSDFENNPVAEDNYAHSGSKSLNLKLNNNYEFISDNTGILFNRQIKEKGATVKFWLKSVNEDDLLFSNQSSEISVQLNGIAFSMKRIASTGEWALYSTEITDWPSSFQTGAPIKATLAYNFQPGEEVYIDDFKFHPLDAEVSCTVYDTKNYKVLAQFDNQHFGLFYQYNREGQLVRKLVETERGMKTVQETQYNIAKVKRAGSLAGQ